MCSLSLEVFEYVSYMHKGLHYINTELNLYESNFNLFKLKWAHLQFRCTSIFQFKIKALIRVCTSKKKSFQTDMKYIIVRNFPHGKQSPAFRILARR